MRTNRDVNGVMDTAVFMTVFMAVNRAVTGAVFRAAHQEVYVEDDSPHTALSDFLPADCGHVESRVR